MARIEEQKGRLSEPLKTTGEVVISTLFSDTHVNCYFPKENSPEAIADITRVLRHLGVFEGIEVEGSI